MQENKLHEYIILFVTIRRRYCLYWRKKKSHVYYLEGNEKLNIRCMNFLLEVNNRAGFFES